MQAQLTHLQVFGSNLHKLDTHKTPNCPSPVGTQVTFLGFYGCTKIAMFHNAITGCTGFAASYAINEIGWLGSRNHTAQQSHAPFA